MRISAAIAFGLLLAGLLLTASSHAMDMPHYDVNSLVYMSTDIVVASLAEDAQHQFTAAVTETLYGELRPSERLDKLTPFLTYFRPMEDRMRVILFLDRRPHQYGFLHADAAKSPFAIPPSGVYLIDTYAHVHEYFQTNNPGPYVAEGYRYWGHQSQPTKEDDLKLPSLDEVKGRITAAIKIVGRIRPLLDRPAVPADASSLISLVDTTSTSTNDCELRMASGIRERALVQLRSLNDAALLLEAYRVSGVSVSVIYANEFIRRTEGVSDRDFENSRVQYLIRTFADEKQDPSLRAAAVSVLLNLAKFHSHPHPGPTQALPLDDNEWLASEAGRIQKISKNIFDRLSEDARLRALALQFLSLENPEMVSDAKGVYREASSTELRFAIEKAFLDVSDDLYGTLAAPGGPIASRVSVAAECGCFTKSHPGPAFVIEYQERKDFEHGGDPYVPSYPALTNLRTRQHFTFEKYDELWGWRGQWDGRFEFQLNSSSAMPKGKYFLTLEYARDGKILSRGYGMEIQIRKRGKEPKISVRVPTQESGKVHFADAALRQAARP